MMSPRSSFILAHILTIFTYYSAASYTFIRKDNINEDCKIVSYSCDNETKIYTSSFTTINSDTGAVKVILPGSFERQLNLHTMGYREPCYNDDDDDDGDDGDDDDNDDDDDYDDGYDNGDSDPPILHSRYECEMKSENVSSECSYQEVIFRYLFTSCYSVGVKNRTLAKGYIQTNYTDVKLLEDCTLEADVDLVQEKYTIISFNVTQFLHNSVLKFVVNDSGCLAETKYADFWWRVELKEEPSDDVILVKNETQNRTVDCSIVLNEEIGLHQLRCEVDWADIRCIVIIKEKSTSPINDKYCYHELTAYRTLEPAPPYDIIEYTSPAVTISRTTNTLILMFIPLTAVVVCVCLRLFFSDTNDTLLKERGSNCSKISPDLKCKVLLLYPQDCDSFMATMKSLQNFLQSFNYFEVYDYFDSKRFGEIACDPQGWLSRLLSQKDVRIILAETDTALLHQLAIAKKCVVNYVSPLPYSNLFAYGLQNLLHSLRPQEYSRIFLIRFEDITQDKENLKLSRYQRYKLPEHLRNLISCMSNCHIISFKEEEELLEMRRLKHSIDKFRQFQQQNPDYHQKLCNNLTKLI